MKVLKSGGNAAARIVLVVELSTCRTELTDIKGINGY